MACCYGRNDKRVGLADTESILHSMKDRIHPEAVWMGGEGLLPSFHPEGSHDWISSNGRRNLPGNSRVVGGA